MGLLKKENGTTQEPKKKHYKGVTIKVYVNKVRFLEEIKRAEKAGIRRVGLLPFTQKPHGFEWEKVANTDSLSKYFKVCSDYYHEHEGERLQEVAKLKLEAQRINEEMKKRGVSV